MQLTGRRTSTELRACRGCAPDQRGTALVEFALVGSLLCLLVFGLIEFGVILAVKSSVTQAASEGARAAVTAPWCPAGSTCTYPSSAPAACYTGHQVTGPDYTCLYAASAAQASQTMSWLSTCSSDSSGNASSTTASVQCSSTVDYCTAGQSSSGLCITTKVLYDYKDNPIFPSLPLLSAFLPNTIPSQTVVKVNPCTGIPSGGAPNCG